jgi:sRNA-binding regulator protein Hfq
MPFKTSALLISALVVLLMLHVRPVNMQPVNKNEQIYNELKDYFSKSFIEQIRADKINYPCFQAGWGLYRFHHVCVKGGEDGLVVGLDGIKIDWSKAKAKNEFVKYTDQWNKMVQSTVVARSIPINDITSVVYENSSVLFTNCHQQEEKSQNPAHLMMKLGALYEIALCSVNATGNKFGPMIVSNFTRTFTKLYTHQCANISLTNWEWGRKIFKITEQKLIEAKILTPDYVHAKNFGFRRPRKGEKVTQEPGQLTCFEDIMLSSRNGIWINKAYNEIAFRAHSAKLFGEPAGAVDSTGKSVEKETDSIYPLVKRPAFCGNYLGPDAVTKSNARIKVFQRTATANLRAFTNLQDIVALAQQYTTVPVEIVTVNGTTTLEQQIRLFNSFDILLSPHGSHLANGIFTMQPSQKVMVEMVPFAFDRVFYANYNAFLSKLILKLHVYS